MSNANTPRTPKGSSRKQTSLFSFFSTPTKSQSQGPKTRDNSQDELLNAIGDISSDAIMADIEEAEKELYESPIKTKSTAKKRAAAAADSDRKRKKPPRAIQPRIEQAGDDDAGMETVDEDAYMPSPEKSDDDNDDDADGDYEPEISPAQGNGRGRVIDDSDDEYGDKPSNAKPLLQQQTPSKKRIKHSISGSPVSSEGPSLMSLMFAQRTSGQPSLSREKSSLSNTSFTSQSSVPLAQRMQTQNLPLTSDESKRARASNFAKKNEERYAWLEDIRDEQKLRPTDPGYDKRTLYIPSSAWSKFSPFERQYWEIKCKHWDTVVFFKKGKFYELYENDASIGHQEFDLKLTDRVNMRMAGVPESSFDHWVAQFIAKGHKVARVDQMESKLAKDMRERGSTKKSDSLVTRELTGILTAGTLVDPSMLTQDLATYCMAVVEATHVSDGGDSKEDQASAATVTTSFGIAFVDTATAQFHLCTIDNDDGDRSALETLLVQINPREVIYVRGGAGPGQVSVPSLTSTSLTKGNSSEQVSMTSPDAWDGMAGLSASTWRVLKYTCGQSTDWIAMAARKEFWDVPTTKREIELAGYFGETSADNSKASTWPAVLQSAAEKEPLALTAIGGLLSYLRTLKLDKDLASLGNFTQYSPIQRKTSLVLDGPTIANLDLFTISSDSGGNAISAAIARGNKTASIEGTLFSLLNHALTPFGRRLLTRWTCHPLRHAADINARLDAVDFFVANGDLCDTISSTLKGLADLERGLSRIHSGRCKVPDFIAVLDGLSAITRMTHSIRASHGDTAPARIETLLASFPALDDLLSEFKASFDSVMALNEGRLFPHPGSDEQYDEILGQINELDDWFDNHLKENRKRFGCASIVYKHMGKEHYQLEMPSSVKVPNSYFRLSATKAVNRYWSPELRIKVQERAEAMETKSMVLGTYQSKLYAKFDRHYSLLMKAVTIVSEIDCLLALSVASTSLGMPYSRPAILESNGSAGGGYIEFKQLRHPCVALSGSIPDFVANDIVLGRRDGAVHGSSDEDGASMILLSGPNMGGKSTLLRQVCLGVILAQLGCYVPAEAATILPVDRLFTRIGARDHLLAGRSTFMVEMAETATILRYSTPRSLVVLDELGRGTSTHDGEAVAFGVLHSLCSRLGCLGIFSTHYGLLAESLLGSAACSDSDTSDQGAAQQRKAIAEPHLRPMYMACAVNEEEHRVTFLYRLQRGVASKSHGMNVAAMAGVPVPIVKRAKDIAEQFEHGVKQKQLQKRRFKQGTQTPSENGTLVGQGNDDEKDDGDADTLPLIVQSDFANLLRMASLGSSGARDSPTKAGASIGDEEDPVGGAHRAKKANENQYWSCIVDHLRRLVV
ncbi:DNA mismatch repair protein msh6 [Dipsacomyces acuminosporus]|nr:DNA mismatch repair protein msh6 [Dipsacomyces acuminosporus]